MPRPKGSRNRKTLAENAGADALLTEKYAALSALKERQNTIAAVIAENNAELRAVKKEIRALDRQIAKLEAKKAENDAAALAAEKKQAVQDKIDSLLSQGKSLDDILNMLK